MQSDASALSDFSTQSEKEFSSFKGKSNWAILPHDWCGVMKKLMLKFNFNIQETLK